MVSQATTLGDFIAELMRKYDHSNRSLAAVAGVSEGAIRNVLKYGLENNAKDPDARTLTNIAKALDVDALRLFRLAGYIPPEPSAHSVRADYLAEMFDKLPVEKQDAVLGVLEAMIEKPEDRKAIQEMRKNPLDSMAGIDLSRPGMLRALANQLIVQLELTQPYQVDVVDPETQLLYFKWKDLPQTSQERIKSLVRQKLSLDYDPTMVDPEWRG